MLAERLNEVAFDVHSHAQNAGLLDQFKAVVGAARALEATDDPSSAANQRNSLMTAFEGLQNILRSPRVNGFSPSEKAILQSIGGWSLTGTRLLNEPGRGHAIGL